jgi:hypothetical protein
MDYLIGERLGTGLETRDERQMQIIHSLLSLEGRLVMLASRLEYKPIYAGNLDGLWCRISQGKLVQYYEQRSHKTLHSSRALLAYKHCARFSAVLETRITNKD